MTKREPQLFHSDVHRPRLQRVRLWFWENPIGQATWMIAGLAIGLAPAYWLGYWWGIILCAGGFAVAGYNALRG